MDRHKILALLFGTAAMWPGRAKSQSDSRHIGVLNVTEVSSAALVQGLVALNWHEGGNLRIERRRAFADAALTERYAAELVALGLDVIVAGGTPAVAALRRQTSTIPIVFVAITDPIGQHFVDSLARPGGTITGFSDFDPPMAAKWLGMLAQLTPPVARVGVMFNPATAPFAGLMLRALEEAAPSLPMVLRVAPFRDEAEAGATMTDLARQEGGSLLVLPDSFTLVHREAIVALATRNRLPAIYWNRSFVLDGGLMSYGIDLTDLLRRAAVYVDRILKGEKPADLPVQQPTKFELVINLKTAKALGIGVPPALLAQTDETIE